MSKKRIVITGLGHVSPVGNDVATGWENIIAGRSGISTITRFDASPLACQFAGEVKNFDITQYNWYKDDMNGFHLCSRCIEIVKEVAKNSGLLNE